LNFEEEKISPIPFRYGMNELIIQHSNFVHLTNKLKDPNAVPSLPE